MFRIVRAGLQHAPEASRLFDAYRTFYKRGNLTESKAFVAQRLRESSSVIMLAYPKGSEKACGFMQLYKTYSSVNASKVCVLNDLYVEDEFRKRGVAKQLIAEAKKLAVEQNYSAITLETAPDNLNAQHLYESLGFAKAPPTFLGYSLPVPKKQADTDPVPARGNRKLVVITGATSGLGRVMIDEFAKNNWMVVGCGRSHGKAAELKEKFKDHYFTTVDVSDEDSVERWAKLVEAHCGKPDLIINNASIINQPNLTWDISPSEFAEVMKVNVSSVVNVIHHFMPFLAQDATIVNISSSWGREGDKNVSAYSASKFAVEGLSQSMAKEVKPGMTVVTLDPGGGVATDMLQICAPEYMSEAPKPEDWATVAVPYILGIDASQNGKALTCPSVPAPAVEDKKK